MKLSLLTLNLAKDLTVEQLTALCRRYGYAAVEFRVDSGHKHEVELSTPEARLRELRLQMENAYLETSCIGTGCRFESPDRAVRRENVDLAKEYVKLAAKMDCRRIRLFGDQFQQGVDRQEHVGWVGEALAEVGEFAAPYRVDALLEMHSDFNHWKYALGAVQIADRENVGIVYNSDLRDLVGGSCGAVYARVRSRVRHVHMHCALKGYPYPELLKLLSRDGYQGYCSVEHDEGSPDAERVAGYYAMLFRAWTAHIG